jgi:hypothetical protein
VLQKEAPEPKPQKAKTSPLPKVWLKGTPPQGKYTWDVGEGLLDVDVGHNVFTFNGKTRHISKAFENGVLYGPMPNPKEEQDVKNKKAKTREYTGSPSFEGSAVPKPVQTPDVTPEPRLVPDPAPTASPKHPDIPGLTAEADAEIRRIFHELAQVPARIPKSIAPQLVAAYGRDIRAVRVQRHGWGKIAKVFRTHGLHIGEGSLRARIEQ